MEVSFEICIKKRLESLFLLIQFKASINDVDLTFGLEQYNEQRLYALGKQSIYDEN